MRGKVLTPEQLERIWLLANYGASKGIALASWMLVECAFQAQHREVAHRCLRQVINLDDEPFSTMEPVESCGLMRWLK
jgi:hypothetical protein